MTSDEGSQPAPNGGEAQVRAVQALFLQYQPGIRAFVLSMVPDFAQADDVIQEAFLVVVEKAQSFELGSNFPAWVRQICRYKALESLRRSRRVAVGLSDAVLDSLVTEPRDFRGDSDQRLVHLEECLKQLAPQARRTIDLRYANDHMPTQIAEIMGGTVAAINVTLSRARAFLRECVRARMTEAKAH